MLRLERLKGGVGARSDAIPVGAGKGGDSTGFNDSEGSGGLSTLPSVGGVVGGSIWGEGGIALLERDGPGCWLPWGAGSQLVAWVGILQRSASSDSCGQVVSVIGGTGYRTV